MPPAYLDQIPKVELHAHLNGCIRERTLFELAKERSVTLNDRHFATKPSQEASDHSMYNVRPRSLKDCFEMFAEIPKCVDDLSSLSRITKEALQDFAEHHVVYLELRSTPKQLFLHTSNDNLDELNLAGKRQYCLTILNVMKDFEQLERKRFVKESSQNNDDCDPRLPMTCRLIIAVDRSKTIKEALEHIDLAVDLRKEFGDRIVGVDLGGNPTKNNFSDFKPAFEKARACGLKITIHCAEVPCDPNNDQTKSRYNEAKSILDFRPDRLGHALLLPPSLQQALIHMKIPVESCPTSNVMTLELSKNQSGSLLEGLQKHPQLAKWLAAKHPVVIGTDDPGVFHTSATKELVLVQKAFALSKDDISKIVLESMNYAFCDTATKTQIKMQIQKRLVGLKA